MKSKIGYSITLFFICLLIYAFFSPFISGLNPTLVAILHGMLMLNLVLHLIAIVRIRPVKHKLLLIALTVIFIFTAGFVGYQHKIRSINDHYERGYQYDGQF